MVRNLAAFLALVAAGLSGPAMAQTDLRGAERIPLWQAGVPGFEARRAIPEE